MEKACQKLRSIPVPPQRITDLQLSCILDLHDLAVSSCSFCGRRPLPFGGSHLRLGFEPPSAVRRQVLIMMLSLLSFVSLTPIDPSGFSYCLGTPMEILTENLRKVCPTRAYALSGKYMQSEEVSSFTPLYACLIDLVLPCRCSLWLKSVNRGVAQPLDWRIGTVLYVNCLSIPY